VRLQHPAAAAAAAAAAPRPPRSHRTCRPSDRQVIDIERAIGCGQVEELIEEAKGELALIPEMASWRYWEQKPAQPDDDDHSQIYDQLAEIDPESVEYCGLSDLAKQARARSAAARSGAPAPPAA
jgi:hypothetical protein